MAAGPADLGAGSGPPLTPRAEPGPPTCSLSEPPELDRESRLRVPLLEVGGLDRAGRAISAAFCRVPPTRAASSRPECSGLQGSAPEAGAGAGRSAPKLPVPPGEGLCLPEGTIVPAER